MKQLTFDFYPNWYDFYIGHIMYTTFCSYSKILEISENYDPFYPHMIAVSYNDFECKQLFKNKDHFLNWYNIFKSNDND
jgi:hypothetical protein